VANGSCTTSARIRQCGDAPPWITRGEGGNVLQGGPWDTEKARTLEWGLANLNVQLSVASWWDTTERGSTEVVVARGEYSLEVDSECLIQCLYISLKRHYEECIQ
jgi:hypothetical protein